MLVQMDMFVVSMVVGGGGLLSMAIGGLSHQHGHDAGHGGAHGHDGGHGGHGHSGHVASGGHNAAGASHGFGHTHAVHDGAAHAHHYDSPHTYGSHTPGAHAPSSGHGLGWLLSAPRVMFSVLLGFGASGLALNSVINGSALIAGAAAGGVAFERLVITPIWNLSMRFASKPALTLESALLDEATAVTSFNRDGEGIVSIELDGQVVQVLARLRPDDRVLGVAVRAGQRVRIEEVNATQNRCTVSVL